MNRIKNSNIFVTGGAGFIGSQLVEELLISEPKKIIILDDLSSGREKNLQHFKKNSHVEFIQGSIVSRKTVDKIMSKSDHCFHLASMSINTCANDPAKAVRVMLQGTFNLIDSAKNHKIKRFIYSSSASVYGLAQHFPTPETDNPYDNKTFYGATKLFGEQMLRNYKYTYGLDYVALRYFNVYGRRMNLKGKYTGVFLKWIDCIKQNTQPIVHGDGSATMDFVYVSDIVRANILAFQSDVTDEVFNIGSGKETSLKEVLYLLLKIHKSKIKPVFLKTKSVNPVSRRRADVSKAKKLLNFQTKITLEQGMKLLSDWYLGGREVSY